ncbi:MAG: aldehyde ferredoxin oxidoreductase N-terminal domain-containing protein [Deltaproteobacteria bacterium]|nr:aldehyde ferredoxin oxidoreductase N-terminal domain-containing protein [Deltaproteobacteria bacterium]
MEYLSSDKIAIVDLATGDITEEELDEDLVLEKLGGAGITTSLYHRFEGEDPIVLGTGVLTGSLIPGAALSIMTAKSPLTGKLSHVPIVLAAGIEFKYSGFDYMVIKGASDKPVYLWIHDGIVDINDAADVWGKDVWAATDTIREFMGDDLIQVLGIGKAGEDQSPLATVCVNYWQGGDRLGFGTLFGKKNLKLIGIRGMGLLEIAEPEEFVEDCIELLSTIKASVGEKKGITQMAAALGAEDIGEWLDPLVHRHMACFNTPNPTNSFVFTDEDPARLEESDVAEPGFLLTDIYPLIVLKRLGLSAKDACTLLKDCAKYGIDAAAVADLSEKNRTTTPDDIRKSFPELKEPAQQPDTGVFSPWAWVGKPDAQSWQRRQAVSYILGIHPLFALTSSDLTEEKLLDMASLGTELELTQETLNEVIADVTGK